MKTFLLNTGLWVEKDNIESIAVFNRIYASTGNFAKPVKTNELDQLYVKFKIITDAALEWLYKWIHENLLDGTINHNRDREIQYITGSDEFIKTVYEIIYSREYNHNNPNIQNVNNLK